jgi:hypothetical protein
MPGPRKHGASAGNVYSLTEAPLMTALLAQATLPTIHNAYELAGLVVILLFQLYHSRQTQQLKGQVNGRLEELLRATRAHAHAEGHLAGVTYEQERTRTQLKTSNNVIFDLANIRQDTATVPTAEAPPVQSQAI